MTTMYLAQSHTDSRADIKSLGDVYMKQ